MPNLDRFVRNPQLGYLEDLKQLVAARRASRTAARAEANKPLHTKIEDWWNSLSASERQPYYKMDELVSRFNCAATSIGAALHHLGWQRRRCWSGSGSYFRYWIPKQYALAGSEGLPLRGRCG